MNRMAVIAAGWALALGAAGAAGPEAATRPAGALAAGTASRAAVELTEDPPLASQPKVGAIKGVISPAGKVKQVYAVCRATEKEYKAARFDAKTGEFVFADLPGDAVYDIGVALADGATIEGIDLGWFEARNVRLAELRRAQLGLPAEKTRAFTSDDVEQLLKYVRDLKDFADIRRPLFVSGDGGRAAMLVEVMRASDFYARTNDQIIWRTELWYFRYHFGGWERVGNVEHVLRRERIPYAQWSKITLVYEPALSVMVDAQGRSEPVKFAIPEKLDPAHGRLAGTEPAQKTEPTVLGVPGPSSKPAN